ncbi:MAG: endolytic transglycosylase MltG [Clostridia bacterium]|nr:endolytic transglycosylase MltG [Clostridia bacterium]
MKRRRKDEIPQEDYSYQRLREEREYGLYWYSWLWRLLRPLRVLACVAAVVIGVLSAAWGYIDRHYIAPVDAGNPAAVTFEVKSGNSLTRVAANLEAAGLVRNRSVFKYYADFLGYGQKIQAGTYTLTRAMSMREIAERLTAGDGQPLVRTITVIEGWTVEQIAAYLKRENAIADEAAFLDLCRTGERFSAYYYIADVLATRNASQRRYALEGYLSPNTYELYTSATAEEIVKKLLSQTEAVFKESWHERAQALGMTMDQVITLASMIEKEAKRGDFARVSAVFHNRLKAGMTLGSDVTVKYVTGTARMSLTGSDLAVDSPYNTYQHTGLPLGPICNPSAAAIEAALYPDADFVSQKYLYFCSKDPDTGELYFSRTLTEHENAVRIYAPLWQAYDQRTGAE